MGVHRMKYFELSLVSQKSDCLLPRKTVEQVSGLSRATIYKLMTESKFPRPVSYGTRAVRWKLSDLVVWQKSLTTKA